MGIATKVSVLLVAIAFFVYLSDFESKGLAQKYGKRIYAMKQDRDRFAGFFQPSKRWKYGDIGGSQRGRLSMFQVGVKLRWSLIAGHRVWRKIRLF